MEQINKLIFILNKLILPFNLRWVFLSILILAVLLNLFLLIRYLSNKRKSKIEKDSNENRTEIISQIEESHSINFWTRSKELLLKFGIFLVRRALIINIIFFVGLAFLFLVIVLPTPKVAFPTEPSLGITEINEPFSISIKFDRPINKKEFKIEILPPLKGEWSPQNKDFLLFTNQLIFSPKETPNLDTRYFIASSGIKNIFSLGKETKYSFSFKTPPVPKVEKTLPAEKDQGVLPGQEIKITFDRSPKNITEVEFTATPEVAFDTSFDQDQTYTLKPKEGWRKSTDYSIKIFLTEITYNYDEKKVVDRKEKKEISNLSFRTIEAPGVANYSPTGSGVLVDTKVKIDFKQDMDQEKTEAALSISPTTEGNISWEGPRTLIFTPNSWQKNTTYYITITTDARAADGSPFEEVFSFSFTTIGYVTVSSFYPSHGTYGVSIYSKVQITFNQAVDHASAESKFSISPQTNGSFSWNGNTLIFTPGSPLAYSQSYTTTIGVGVKTVYGLDSVSQFSATFTTQSQSVVLGVPSYAQQHWYTCDAAAARSALAYRGVYVSEAAVYNAIGFDNTPFSGSWGDPNSIWGDPDVGRVGGIDGMTPPGHGYGAYPGPVANAIQSFGRGAEIKSGWNVSGIAQEIATGNPVMVWWVNRVWPAYEVYWKTPGGKTIRGVNSLHVQVVKGFTGTIENPTSFIVTDSGYGYPSQTISTSNFISYWSWFGYTGIIVR